MSNSVHLTGPSMCRQNSHPTTRTAPSSRFQAVQLTEDQLDVFHGAAHKALSLTVKEFVKFDGKTPLDTQRWRYMRSRNGLTVYHDRHQDASAQHSTLLVAGMVKARLADVMEGLYMDTTEDTRLVQHRIHPRFVDADVLSVVEQRSAEHPYNFTGLKWALLKSSNTGIVSNRDLCYLEKLGTIALADGRQLGYFIMQSVNLPECAPSQSTKVVRADISLCYLFEETKSGHVGVYMTGSMVSYGPRMLWKMARRNFADIALSIGNAVDVAYAKRFTERVLTRHERLERTLKSSATCESCQCCPSFFDRHRQCAGCPKMSVCKKCRVKMEIFHREDYATLKLARASFCFKCMESVREQSSTQPKNSSYPKRKLNQGPPVQVCGETHPRRPFTGNSRRTGMAKKTSSGSVSSATTASDGGSWSEPERDSERSLGLFMQKVRDELDEVKYDELDMTSRLSELAVLGSGAIPRYTDADAESDSDVASGLTSTSYTSSDFSICDVEMESFDGDDDDDDDVESIRPLRRSLQPPEMLQTQKLSWDGSLLESPRAKYSPPKVTSSSFESNRNLMSRLERASRLAEQTHRFTKEQARYHKQRVYTPSRCGSVTL